MALPSVGDESAVSARDERIAKTYIEHHWSRVPVVMAARVGRLWDVYDPVASAEDINEGRPINASLAGMAVYYLLLPAAVVGVFSLRRRRLTQWPLLVPAGVLTVVAALAYGLVRFRAPFEVCLVVLAAAGVDALVRAAGRRRGRHTRPRDVTVARGSPTNPRVLVRIRAECELRPGPDRSSRCGRLAREPRRARAGHAGRAGRAGRREPAGVGDWPDGAPTANVARSAPLPWPGWPTSGSRSCCGGRCGRPIRPR